MILDASNRATDNEAILLNVFQFARVQEAPMLSKEF